MLKSGGSLGFCTILITKDGQNRRDHPIQGSKILQEQGYPEDVIYAIKSHVDGIEGCPRVSQLDKTLFACDELCGFITAVALVRPEGMDGMKSKSVRKKMKQKSFAEKVNRERHHSWCRRTGPGFE